MRAGRRRERGGGMKGVRRGRLQMDNAAGYLFPGSSDVHTQNTIYNKRKRYVCAPVCV